jgi:hypothetical protein
MLRRTKRSKNEIVAPKEEEEDMFWPICQAVFRSKYVSLEEAIQRKLYKQMIV